MFFARFRCSGAFKKTMKIQKMSAPPDKISASHKTKTPDRIQQSEAITVKSNSLKPEHTDIKQSETKTQRNLSIRNQNTVKSTV